MPAAGECNEIVVTDVGMDPDPKLAIYVKSLAASELWLERNDGMDLRQSGS